MATVISWNMQLIYLQNEVLFRLILCTFLVILHKVLTDSWEHAVAQLVEALRYKPEGRGFDYRWCYWNFSLT
jgi:hypothetical protein